MNEHLEEYLHDAPPDIHGDLLDLQRAALREVLKLSEESAQPLESEIEQQYKSAEAAAEDRFRKSRDKIDEMLRNIRETSSERHRETVERIQAQYESDSQTIEGGAKTARERISEEAETIIRDARAKYDQDAWLADSLAGAAKDKIRVERERMRKEVPEIAARLQAIHENAVALLDEYRLPVPEDAAHPEYDPSLGQDPSTAFRRHHALAQQHLEHLRTLKASRLFRDVRGYILVVLACAASVALCALYDALYRPAWPPFAIAGPIVLLGTFGIGLAVGMMCRRQARRHAQIVYGSVQTALTTARLALDARVNLAVQDFDRREAEVREELDTETQAAKSALDASLAEVNRQREASFQRIIEKNESLRIELQDRRTRDIQHADEQHRQGHPDLQQRYNHDLATAREHYEQRMQQCRTQYEAARSALEARWKQGLDVIQHLLHETARLTGPPFADWTDAFWQKWSPPETFTSFVRFGRFLVDPGQLASGVRRLAPQDIPDLSFFSPPALLAFPDRSSLLLQTAGEGRDEALKALRAVMLRLLTSLPPGRVHFTIIDPVGLGENFAGFMHLSDYEEALVGGRIWTESAHIEQRLTDLTNHMENVIQKYLRNEFDTIDAYNEQAGELAEPYRFLVVANFPANFTEEAARRLVSIVTSGPRCGVYTLIAHDTRLHVPPGIQIEDIEARSVNLVYRNGQFVWQDDVLRQFPLTLDAPPSDECLTRIMHVVGNAARDSSRVEVPFSTIAPSDEQFWTSDGTEDIRVPIGRTGAIRLQHLRLGRGVAQHALIAGKTGSGKSTLFHVIITNLVQWYGPDEVEFYLVDFKKGVEFKTYVTHELPHARAVALESDREFGLSVLHRLDLEMERRGDLFRQLEVQDLAAYRRASGTRLPRTLLIVDEFQIFFSEDDKIAQDATILLDRLVRQGRAFGIHVLLGSQTLGGTSGLARSTIGQMAVRIALQCSEADSQLILDDDNVAARLLSRPGEAIYNDAGGLVEGNSPFQTAWLSDESRDKYLDRVCERARGRSDDREPLVVFEGNAPSDIRKNRPLSRLLDAPDWPPATTPPRLWLGEAVAIKDPTTVTFRRQSGANLLIVGQREDAAMAFMTAALVCLAAQHDPQSARFVILDGSPADSPLAGEFRRVAAALPHETRLIEWRDVPDAIAELDDEAQRRQDAGLTNAPSVYLLVYGLQRYRMLRRREDDFGFSSDDAEKAPNPDRQFAHLLREGPPLGIHILVWSDTPAALERTLDRQTMSEFDNRLLFQMSSSDSSNLIDSPAANTLGFYRALFYSEEQGILEKFRPYALVEDDWLASIRQRLESKPSHPAG